MMFRRLVIISVVALACVLGSAYYVIIVPNNTLMSLLSGSSNVAVERLVVNGQGRTVECNSDELLKELTDALRRARGTREFTFGSAYNLKLGFGGYRTIDVTAYVSPEAVVIAVWSNPLEGLGFMSDPNHYELDLPSQPAAGLARLLEILRGEERGTFTLK